MVSVRHNNYILQQLLILNGTNSVVIPNSAEYTYDISYTLDAKVLMWYFSSVPTQTSAWNDQLSYYKIRLCLINLANVSMPLNHCTPTLAYYIHGGRGGSRIFWGRRLNSVSL